MAKKAAKAKVSPRKKTPVKKAHRKKQPQAEGKAKTGRPEVYSQELADKICSEIASTSKSLRTICDNPELPCVATVLKWLREDTKGFLAQYARAKEEQADLMVEEMIDISDDGSNDLMTITKGDISYEIENKEVTNRSKLRVETRKWIASKLKPKKYGDKLDLTGTVKHKIGKDLADEIYEE